MGTLRPTDLVQTVQDLETAMAEAAQAWRETRITGDVDCMKQIKDSTAGALCLMQRELCALRTALKRQQEATRALISAASIAVCTQDHIDKRLIPADQIVQVNDTRAALKVAIERAIEASK